jgi:hypothetical protein
VVAAVISSPCGARRRPTARRRSEFAEIILAVRAVIAPKGLGGGGGGGGAAIAEDSEGALERWFKESFFFTVNQAMPMRGDSFQVRCCLPA